MQSKHLRAVFCSFVLLALTASGCVQGTAPEEEGPYAVLRQALVDALEQCQASMDDCVSSAAGPTDVLDCRSEFESCVTAVTETPDAIIGAAPVPNPTDLADMGDLPTADLPVDLPSTELLELPDVSDMESVLDCPQSLTDCVAGGGDVMDCADQARDCMGSMELPVDLPSTELLELPDVSDMESVLDCPQSLGDCVAGGGDVVECADQARTCMGADLLPVDMPVELLPTMTLPDTEGGIECMTSLADCVAGGGDIMDCADQARDCAESALPTAALPDVTDLGSDDMPSLFGDDLPLVGELPDPLETIAGGADCAQGLAECMASGDPTSACAEAARSCLENPLPF